VEQSSEEPLHAPCETHVGAVGSAKQHSSAAAQSPSRPQGIPPSRGAGVVSTVVFELSDEDPLLQAPMSRKPPTDIENMDFALFIWTSSLGGPT
jgi:hypothetical protein